MHNRAAEHHGLDFRYGALELRADELVDLPALFHNENLLGANITIPYKEHAFQMVDQLSNEAEEIGAINTIVREGAKLLGENTDHYGFSRPIVDADYDLSGEKAVIFGTGGATKAILYALAHLGLEEVAMVSRSPNRNVAHRDLHLNLVGYGNWQAHAEEASLIVNATPLGMDPNIDQSPVEERDSHLLEGRICYDIVYNPLETKFLRQAVTAGAEIIAGLEMLIHQGDRAFQLWTGKAFPVAQIRHELKQILRG